jgi:hypothetical protein
MNISALCGPLQTFSIRGYSLSVDYRAGTHARLRGG